MKQNILLIAFILLLIGTTGLLLLENNYPQVMCCNKVLMVQ